MGKPDGDDLDLPLPPSSETDAEPCGVEDSEFEPSPGTVDESVGLDTETGVSDGFDASSLLALDHSEESDLDTTPLGSEFDTELGDDDEESGWTEDSEASATLWEPDDLDDDLNPSASDEGLDGVDESNADDELDDDPAPADRHEEEEQEEDEASWSDLEDDWMRESPGER